MIYSFSQRNRINCVKYLSLIVLFLHLLNHSLYRVSIVNYMYTLNKMILNNICVKVLIFSVLNTYVSLVYVFVCARVSQ